MTRGPGVQPHRFLGKVLCHQFGSSRIQLRDAAIALGDVGPRIADGHLIVFNGELLKLALAGLTFVYSKNERMGVRC
jgi:hypothetical protein